MCKFPRISHTLLARRGLYITAVWIRQVKDLNIKRLLGLLLLMGMVGCGGGERHSSVSISPIVFGKPRNQVCAMENVWSFN